MCKKTLLFAGMFLLLSALPVGGEEKGYTIEERLAKLEEGQRALSKRIDELSNSLNARIDELRTSLNTRIGDLSTSLNARIDDLNGRIHTIYQLFGGMFIAIFAGIIGLLGYLISISRKLGAIESAILGKGSNSAVKKKEEEALGQLLSRLERIEKVLAEKGVMPKAER